MKGLFKKSLSTLLVLLTLFSCVGMTAFADTTKNEGGFTFITDYDGKKAYVSGIYSAAYSMTVPDQLLHDGLWHNVWAIADNVGVKDTTIRSLKIGKNVISIGKNAFSQSNLTSVTIDGGANFGSGAFNDCKYLTSVYFGGKLTGLDAAGSAFVNCNKNLKFVYMIDSKYYSEEALFADLNKLGGGEWVKASKYDRYYTWSNKYAGYTVITSNTSIVPDTSEPAVKITVGDYTWQTEAKASKDSPVGFPASKYNELVATVKIKELGDPSSGLDYVGIYKTKHPVEDHKTIVYSEVTNYKFVDGWYTFTTKVNASGGVLYVHAEDGEGMDTLVNTPYLLIDGSSPTVSIINTTLSAEKNYTEILKLKDTEKDDPEIENGVVYGLVNSKAKQDADLTYNQTVKLKVDAKDTGSGVKAIYYDVRYGNNVAGYSDRTAMEAASKNWAKLSGDTLEVKGDSKTYCLVYFKVVDDAGNSAYASTQYFRPGTTATTTTTNGAGGNANTTTTAAGAVSPAVDTEKPTFSVTYTDENDVEKTVVVKDGDTLTVPSNVKIVANDNSGQFTSFNVRNKKTNKVTYHLWEPNLKGNGEYAVNVIDKAGNSMTATLIINIPVSDKPVVTISGLVKGVKKDVTAVNGKTYTYNHPVTIKITDDGTLKEVTYSYTDSSNNKKTGSVSETLAKNGFELKEYYTYTIKVKDHTKNEVTFTLSIKEPTRKITKIAIDTGNETSKTHMDCMGGSFKATVTGSEIYHKIAVFNGTARVGDIITIGSATESISTVDIASGKLVIPANSSDKAAEFIIRYYPASTADAQITSTSGTQLGKITMDAYKAIITVDPTTLEFTAEGGTKELKIAYNCDLSIVPSNNLDSNNNSWLSLDKSASVQNTCTIYVTATKNTGLDRNAVITISNKSDSKTSVTIKVSQKGVGDAERLAGSNRIATAIAISKSGWTSAKTVILASGKGFADALAGVPLAAAADAPILLTNNTSSGLEADVMKEIERLGAKKVYILGGSKSVSEQIYDELENEGITIERLAGDNRYGTCVAIAEELASLKGKKFTTLYFASGENYPDALSVSVAAAIEGNPVLYVPGKGEVENYVEEFVTENKCKTGVVLGGEGAVSKKGYDSLTHLGLKMSRISGSDRYETSVKINQQNQSLFTGKGVAVATGTSFPDALAGGALCAKLKMPVILVSEKSYGDAVDYIKSVNPDDLIIFGGTAAISDNLAIKLADAK